ncbi:ATPase domain-containing protein [Massilia yuzhufengensis]|uniref:non-specific serine/threonine protein kinase n=1 Tax=Massilia yuzhufengensis TaxID=1164594 RepID=A0A1I1JAA2_9BURK|nr:ATPase domain-containing protein [Massilia yuzhufengensis]SFC45295.1 circadian clock protein KaiC [Massilia yuzhufengensis]
MTDKVSLGTLATGVPGLDVLLGGGLNEFSFNMITGAPGCGKTTMAHQMMFALAGPERRALFFTVLGEPPLKMLRYQQQYSFFDMDKVGTSIRYVNLTADLRAGDFNGVLERITKEVEDFGPSLVFVDSFRSVIQTGRSGQEGTSDLQYFVQELGTRMTSWMATTFLIGEYQHNDTEANPIMTVADGMIALSQLHEGDAVVRKIRVVKMRGQAHMGGSHTFRITDNGLRIYPRLLPPLAADRHPGVPVATNPARIPTGTPGLDAMLHGGLPQGHSLLAIGPTGCGKTILGTHFLQAGVAQGETGVLMCFEKGTGRLRNAEMAAMIQSGQVAVVESRLIDLTMEELEDELTSAIDRTGARRVVIDSLSEVTLYLAPECARNLREGVFRMLSSLARRGVSVLVTTGLDDRTVNMNFARADIAYMTDAIVAMRYAEVDGQVRRYMAVVKVRGSNHSSDLREYRITDEGIEIDPIAAPVDGVLFGRTDHANPGD